MELSYTGTKCISGEFIATSGLPVNDMHAEILVRRAMKKYLYRQIELVQASQPSVLVPVDNGECFWCQLALWSL